MKQGEALLPEMSYMGVWEPKGLSFPQFWFESWSDFVMLLYIKYFISN